MQEFLHIALSFPTVLFTAMMIVMVLYWMLVILGALDLDIFELDLDFDIDMDGDVDFEVDVDADVDGEVIGGPGLVVTLLGALGLGTVPVTIIASFWVLLSWMLSFSSVYYLAPMLGGLSAIVAIALAVGSFVAAIPLNIVIMQPFIQLFRAPEQTRGGQALIGKMCVVTTGTVSETFGQAKAKDGGAGLVLSVRCDGGNRLKRGSKALVIDYDEERHAYIVEPYDTLMGHDRAEEIVLSEPTLSKSASSQPELAEQETNATAGEQDS
jgi:hypothetical protein